MACVIFGGMAVGLGGCTLIVLALGAHPTLASGLFNSAALLAAGIVIWARGVPWSR